MAQNEERGAPGESGRGEADVCAIAVMAKAPVAGRVKTRLSPPLDPEEARLLSAAFLRDTTETIRAAGREAPVRGHVAYAPAGSEALFAGALADGTGLLLADGAIAAPADVHGFGRSLLHAAQALFARGYGAVCLLNSDSPTLPVQVLRDAAAALARPGRAVLGPAEDGGYYLLGMRAGHARLFADIAWSTGEVAGQTRARAAELGLEVVTLPTWYDVDDRASLRRLIADLPRSDVARATAACVARLGLAARFA
ncbi:MAG: TIGR04282 family arsenosugar biosynthesis glycosyltransferase [Acidisphaera sp.]|nr:TIGR04282 family arsenosugar biosynthesis glycosyltransferase [Acidisphaera sp.]